MCLVEIDVLFGGSVTGSVQGQCNLDAFLCWVINDIGRTQIISNCVPSIQTKIPCAGYMNRLRVSISETVGEFVAQTETQYVAGIL
jgi:hypothetical protein